MWDNHAIEGGERKPQPFGLAGGIDENATGDGLEGSYSIVAKRGQRALLR